MRLLTITLITLSVLFGSGALYAEDGSPAVTESPRAVVARWLELHRAGKRDEASALTTDSHYHRARYVPPSTLDTGGRVERALGNERAAAVVTSSLEEARDGERVLLFWLVRRDGVWRINKSDVEKRWVVDERLRGFLEAGDVSWDVQRGDLLGNWESGPCTPPGIGGIACGSRLQLRDDNRYRLIVWGPAGPPRGNDGDHVLQGSWQLADGRIVLSDQDRQHECQIAWLTDKLLVLESLDEKGDGKGHSTYERADAAQQNDGDGESP